MNLTVEDYFTNGQLNITEEGWEKLEALVLVVLNRYYGLIKGTEREDLYQEGVVKAMTLLRNGNFDSTKGKIHNFLYTGIRNEMGNYLYRIGRSFSVDDTVFLNVIDTNSNTDDDMMAESVLRIPESLIRTMANSFFIKPEKIKENLRYIGFSVGKGNVVQNEDTDMICVMIIHRHLRTVRR